MRPAATILLLVALTLAGCAHAPAATAPTSSGTTAPMTQAHPSQPAASQPTHTTTTVPPVPSLLPALPTRVGHVFIIVLENEGYNKTFGATPGSTYLAQNLTRMGRLLTQYYGTGHASLDNYIAMTSGQAPNPATQGDCAFYADFKMATMTGGQAVGQGCVYPKEVPNIADQLMASNHTWRAYAEDMANVPATAPPTCRHQPVNSQDTWQGSTDAKDQYATRHVPFVYYHSIIDQQKLCDEHVVDLKQLLQDLNATATTPEYAFITPDVCSDGHDATCVNPDQKGGYAGIEAFLKAWVPRIMNSTAYKQDGLLVVNFDEADVSPPNGGEACCGEQAGYNTALPGIYGAGGGRVGAVLLSPCITPGSTDATPYNHYSLLRTVEDIFNVPHIGYAAADGLKSIGLGSCPTV